MSPELIRRAMPYLLAIIVVLGVLWGAYSHGVSTTDKAWQSKWDAQALELSEAKTKAVTLVREEEQRRQAAIDGVRQHAEQQIALAEADAAAADAAADSLREQAKRLAARAGQCTSHPTATQSGKATAQPSVVLADVLGRADERAGQLAAAYDRARAAGLTCEAAYDALRNERKGQ